jgi:outer membrane protein
MNMVGKSAVLVLIVMFGVWAKEYSLDELLKTGIGNSRMIHIVEQQMSQAQDSVNFVIGGALPSVDSKVTYGHDVSTATLPPGSVAHPNALALSLSARQPLYNQGKTFIGLHLAKLSMQTLLCKYNDEKTQVRASITELFYRAIIARKNCDAQRQALEIAGETHRLAKTKFAVGSTGELDTIQSGMNLMVSQFNLQKAQSDLRMAYQTILAQCIIDDSVESFSVVGEIPETSFDLSLDQVLEKVEKENRTLTQLRGAEQIQKELVRLASADFLPLAYATAGVGASAVFDDPGQLSGTQPWVSDRSLGAGLTFNLFNGLQTWQRVKRARSELTIFTLSELQTIDEIMLQAKGAYDTLQNAQMQLHVTAAVVKLAQKAYDITKVAYGVGSRTILDLQNAELSLNQARITYNSAQLTCIESLIGLRVLMGDY